MGVERRVWEREAEQPMNGWIRKAIAENDFCFVCLLLFLSLSLSKNLPFSLSICVFLCYFCFWFGCVCCLMGFFGGFLQYRERVVGVD